jgi:hypothetical protein
MQLSQQNMPLGEQVLTLQLHIIVSIVQTYGKQIFERLIYFERVIFNG